jgi:periplasmic protein CpxP/Spy
MLLAVLNLTFLAYIWFERSDRKRPDAPKDARDYLVRELNLNVAQQRHFDSLRQGHFEQMQRDREEMRKLKDAFFGQLKNAGDTIPAALAQEIGAVQARIDLNTFHHFAALRRICTDEQQKKFDDIIQNVLKNLGRPGPPPGDKRMPPIDR